MSSITAEFEGKSVQLAAGARLTELTGRMTHPLGIPIGALVNRRLVGLDSEAPDRSRITVVTKHDPDGANIFRRSACLVLYEGFRRVAPQVRVVSGQSIGDWHYFDVDGHDGPLGPLLERVRSEMCGIVERDERFEVFRMGSDAAIDLFEREGRGDRVALLRTWWHESLRMVRLGGCVDILYGPVVPSAGYLDGMGSRGATAPPGFAMHAYAHGFVLGFAVMGRTAADLATPPPFMPGLYGIFQETKAWNRVIGVSNVGELNRACITSEHKEVVRVAEGFHEKKIAAVADAVAARRDRTRLVLVAGPSASGKTTFTKRLGVQFRVAGLHPVALSVDDYYIDRERTPVGEDGRPDFEALEAVDLDLFNDHLRGLLAGEEVATPKYDFVAGRRAAPQRWNRLRLEPGDVLIVEGIHGLNDRLSAAIPPDAKFRIYVSALTQLSIDAQNRISTSDGRLLRRIVRDRLYRGHSAAATITAWPSVRAGERKHIFPFQESADATVNTALPYELAVLKVFAHRFLLEVPTDHAAFVEAYRLLKFLELFVPIFPDNVPQNSILREFIGGSSFRY